MLVSMCGCAPGYCLWIRLVYIGLVIVLEICNFQSRISVGATVSYGHISSYILYFQYKELKYTCISLPWKENKVICGPVPCCSEQYFVFHNNHPVLRVCVFTCLNKLFFSSIFFKLIPLMI